MSTLELITKASSFTSDSPYPIVLNPDPILLTLNPKPQQPNPNSSFITPLNPWSISQTDSQLIQLTQTFHKTLKTKLQNPNSFTKSQFITLFNSHLLNIAFKASISVPLDEFERNSYTYAKLLVQKLGFLIGHDVLGLVLEACLLFELWEVLESLIVNELVDGSGSGSGCKSLVNSLIEKSRAALVCLCVKHVLNLQVLDVLSILKFFLSPGKDGYRNMVGVREEWERRAGEAIEKKRDDAVLVVMAHDEFTSNELCLHYLVASENVDDVMFSDCVGKLNGLEVMGFVRYLKKWLVKYEKFPQACVTGCESVPSLERVTKCFGLVIDEHFSSLVMLPEFREEVESVELVVNSLAAEARLCCNLANFCEGLDHSVSETRMAKNDRV